SSSAPSSSWTSGRCCARRRSSPSTSSATARRARCAGRSRPRRVTISRMIPFEDLSAALDDYVARTRGGAPAAPQRGSSAPPPSADDPPTTETQLPMDAMPSIRSHGGGEDDATHVGGMASSSDPQPLEPVFDDRSNELDIGDVLSDDES